MIKEKLQDQIKAAMKSGDKDRLGTLRLLLSAVKDFEINTRTTPADTDIISIFRKAIKQRKDSIEAFRGGGRADLAEKEEAEIAIIESFLPAAMSDSQVQTEVDAAIAETGASSMKEIGAVMKAVMARLGGRAEGSVINRIVKERLTR